MRCCHDNYQSHYVCGPRLLYCFTALLRGYLLRQFNPESLCLYLGFIAGERLTPMSLGL